MNTNQEIVQRLRNSVRASVKGKTIVHACSSNLTDAADLIEKLLEERKGLQMALKELGVDGIDIDWVLPVESRKA